MTYRECLHSMYSDLESWIIILVGMIIACLLWRFSRPFFAIACIGASPLLAASWAYLYHELNCIELYGP